MKNKILLIIIIICAFVFRLYKIDSPLADWHSWRQVDTSAVSRNYIKNKIDLLHPIYDDLSNIPSNLENPNGYRFVEFPIYNALQAISYQSFPQITLEEWGRLITIFSSLLTLLFIYLLVKRHAGSLAGLSAAFFYAFLPFSVFYGRVVLPDPTMVVFAMGSLWFASEFSEKKKTGLLILSTILFALALLVKPTAIFFALPIVYLLVIAKNSAPKTFLYLLSFTFSLLPLLVWRQYILNFPEGIPASSWLLNGDGIRFKGAWWRWLFGERVSKLILGYWGVVFLSLGIFSDKFKKQLVLYLLIFSSFIYLAVFATGNVRHDYYQIPIIPSLAIFCGIGLAHIIKKKIIGSDYPKLISIPITLTLLFLTFALSWYEVQGYFNINHPEIVEAGKKVNEIVPIGAKVVAPYNGDTAFLYQTNRQGWPLLYDANDIQKQVALGATYYVSVNFDEPTLKIMKECKTLFQNKKYVIVELKCSK